MLLDVKKIIHLQNESVNNWHEVLTAKAVEVPWVFIEENSKWNFCLWHEEDVARIIDIDPQRMIVAKRNIDKFNQARNNSMEKIDEWVLNAISNLQNSVNIRLHSETPGMMIDRLSIMSLKKYHMSLEANRIDASDNHRFQCNQKLNILEEQISDLSFCLEEVLDYLERGHLKFKVYRQLKMYNDPTLNPELYKRNK